MGHSPLDGRQGIAKIVGGIQVLLKKSPSFYFFFRAALTKRRLPVAAETSNGFP